MAIVDQHNFYFYSLFAFPVFQKRERPVKQYHLEQSYQYTGKYWKWKRL